MNTDNMTVSGETIDFGPCASWTSTIRRPSTASSTAAGGMPMATSPHPAVESRAARRDAAAADRCRRRQGHRARHRVPAGSIRSLRTALARRIPPQTRLAGERGRRPRVGDGPVRGHARRSGRLHQHVPCAGRRGNGRRGTHGSFAAWVVDGASGWRANPVASSAVSKRCNTRTPPTFRAITASRKSSRPPCRTEILHRSMPCTPCCPGPSSSSRASDSYRTPPLPHERVRTPSAAREPAAAPVSGAPSRPSIP